MSSPLEVQALHRYRCTGCGYGATCRSEPERCPMCQRSAWFEEGWSPLTGELDPGAAPLLRELDEISFFPGVPMS